MVTLSLQTIGTRGESRVVRIMKHRMSGDHSRTPIPRDGRLSAARDTRRLGRLLPVCCVCGLVRDELGRPPEPVRGMTPQAYRDTSQMNPADRLLTHTYCPECLTKALERVRREIQTRKA